jgi:hypothetical protein
MLRAPARFVYIDLQRTVLAASCFVSRGKALNCTQSMYFKALPRANTVQSLKAYTVLHKEEPSVLLHDASPLAFLAF